MKDEWILTEIPGTDVLASVYVDDRPSFEDVQHGDRCRARMFGYERLRGIYILMRGSEVIWVGRTNDIHRRIDSHKGSGRKFDYALFLHYQNDDLHPLEMKWTARLRPTEISKRTQAAADHFTDKKYEKWKAARDKMSARMRVRLQERRLRALQYV